jgi:hypothetical protein
VAGATTSATPIGAGRLWTLRPRAPPVV